MTARAYDPATGLTRIVTAAGEEVLVGGRYDVHPGRTNPRKRKDRHVPAAGASSVVERTSALASDGVLNMSREDRRKARQERAAERRTVARGNALDDMDALGLAAMRASLPPA